MPHSSVDTALDCTGAAGYPCRFLRAVKRRIGATEEICVIEMVSEALGG